MTKRTTSSLTEDEIRESILNLLYERWKYPSGVDSSKVKISEIKSGLKQKGIGAKEVIRNLQYLVETNWVKRNVKEFRVHTDRYSIPSPSYSYTISSQGIDYFEGRSKFGKKLGSAGINIENVSGIVTIGDQNVVRQDFEGLFRMLDDFDNKIRLTNELTDDQKLEYSSDVKTIQDQLSKSHPDKGIVAKAWGALKGVAAVGSLINVAEKVRSGLEQAFGNLPPPS